MSDGYSDYPEQAHETLRLCIEMAAEDCREMESEGYSAENIAYGNQYVLFGTPEYRPTPASEAFFWRLVFRHFHGFSQHVSSRVPCDCSSVVIPDVYICRLAGV